MRKNRTCVRSTQILWRPFLLSSVVDVFVAGSTVGENPEEPNHVWILSWAWCVRHQRPFPAGKSPSVSTQVDFDLARCLKQAMVHWQLKQATCMFYQRGKKNRWTAAKQEKTRITCGDQQSASVCQINPQDCTVSVSSGADIETTADSRQEWRRFQWSNEWHSCTG